MLIRGIVFIIVINNIEKYEGDPIFQLISINYLPPIRGSGIAKNVAENLPRIPHRIRIPPHTNPAIRAAQRVT